MADLRGEAQEVERHLCDCGASNAFKVAEFSQLFFFFFKCCEERTVFRKSAPNVSRLEVVGADL